MGKVHASPTRETPQTGDVIGHTGNHSAPRGDSQEQYYRYMLLKEKIGNTTEGKAILAATSEREVIENEILGNLVNITESSPEFAQLVSITGSSDRFEMSRILAEAVYDKMRAEQVLSFYTPSKARLEENFYTKTLASAQSRMSKVVNHQVTTANPIADVLRGIFGAF